MIDIVFPLFIFAGTVYALFFKRSKARTRDKIAMLFLSAIAVIYFVHALTHR